MYLQVMNKTRERMLAKNVSKADSFFARLGGLLIRPPLEIDEGLLIVPCNSIHCVGMKYPIDAVFFDKKQVVVGLVENLKPLQFSAIYWRAQGCLELIAGTIRKNGVALGDQLLINQKPVAE
jgi:uncharacterized protein